MHDPQPADGDDYTYLPRQPYTPPEVSSQRIGLSDFHTLLAELRRVLARLADQDRRALALMAKIADQEQRIADLEHKLADWTGD